MVISQETITSRQNRLVVETGKLSDRKEREARGLFRFDGKKLFGEAVACGVAVEYVLLAESRASELLSFMTSAGAPEGMRVFILSDSVFAKLSEERAPEGILTVAAFPELHTRGTAADHALLEAGKDGVLLLESVRDPGNVGTILRSAAAFGVTTVAMSADCADIYNSKTVRGAMGALFRLHIATFDHITEAIGLLREAGHRVYAAALDPTAVRLAPSVLRQGDCVVVGNEGHGLSQEAKLACDSGLYIPMEPGNESLNAAVAASVILWNMYCS